MMTGGAYQRVFLKPGKEALLNRRHLWIFSGALQTPDETISEGSVVEVFSSSNQYLATGHYFRGTIAVRILSFNQRIIDAAFWQEAIQSAYDLRVRLGLVTHPSVNCYRLINAEGDRLPGLIVDYYNGVVVLQAHTTGMYRERYIITEALKNIYGERLKAVYDKSDKTLQQNTTNEYLYGKPESNEIIEHNNRFRVNWETGQKTGFFLDQRDNRLLLSGYVQNKVVLNAFCYTGGFSVYALNAGASHVDSVDISKSAIEWCDINVKLNDATNRHKAYVADVVEFLQHSDKQYDVIVLDPPAFAKNISSRHHAVQGYKRLNTLGLKKIAKKGILFTFSCSQVIDRELFYHTVVSAAIEARRNARVLHHLSQPPDHPVNIFHPEGYYLKGLVLYVE